MEDRHFDNINEEIMKIIKKLSIIDKFINGIPLAEVFREVKAHGILTLNFAIRKHIKNLEDMGKIKVDNWAIKVKE